MLICCSGLVDEDMQEVWQPSIEQAGFPRFHFFLIDLLSLMLCSCRESEIIKFSKMFCYLSGSRNPYVCPFLFSEFLGLRFLSLVFLDLFWALHFLSPCSIMDGNDRSNPSRLELFMPPHCRQIAFSFRVERSRAGCRC